MGTLTLPPTGSIYLDTSAIIYSVERNEPYLALLAPAWQQAEAGQLVLVCSELAVAETLVRPIREDNLDLVAAFRSVFAAPEVQVMPATRQLWEATARLRAQTGLKRLTPYMRSRPWKPSARSSSRTTPTFVVLGACLSRSWMTFSETESRSGPSFPPTTALVKLLAGLLRRLPDLRVSIPAGRARPALLYKPPL